MVCMYGQEAVTKHTTRGRLLTGIRLGGAYRLRFDLEAADQRYAVGWGGSICFLYLGNTPELDLELLRPSRRKLIPQCIKPVLVG
jgi:hypothetical protein